MNGEYASLSKCFYVSLCYTGEYTYMYLSIYHYLLHIQQPVCTGGN